MECDHEWLKSPFRIAIQKRKGMAAAENAMLSFQVCATCGVLRVDPKLVPELAPK